MDGEHGRANSHRLSSLWEKFNDKRYRDGYVAAHTRSVLARQMRNFRADLSQAEFGAQLGKRQTVISRLESPAYGSWTLRTMFEIARKQNIAVFARFVDFPTFLKYTSDLSDYALNPSPYGLELATYGSDASQETAHIEELLNRNWKATSISPHEDQIEVARSLGISVTKKIAANDNQSYCQITRANTNVR